MIIAKRFKLLFIMYLDSKQMKIDHSICSQHNWIFALILLLFWVYC